MPDCTVTPCGLCESRHKAAEQGRCFDCENGIPCDREGPGHDIPAPAESGDARRIILVGRRDDHMRRMVKLNGKDFERYVKHARLLAVRLALVSGVSPANAVTFARAVRLKGEVCKP